MDRQMSGHGSSDVIGDVWTPVWEGRAYFLIMGGGGVTGTDSQDPPPVLGAHVDERTAVEEIQIRLQGSPHPREEVWGSPMYAACKVSSRAGEMQHMDGQSPVSSSVREDPLRVTKATAAAQAGSSLDTPPRGASLLVLTQQPAPSSPPPSLPLSLPGPELQLVTHRPIRPVPATSESGRARRQPPSAPGEQQHQRSTCRGRHLSTGSAPDLGAQRRWLGRD